RGIDDDELIAATVRLKIQDPQGHSSGTGTLIDARGGEALILTCGHIFRDSQGKGRIEVDLFGPHASQRIPGRLVRYDLKADVGLVAIRVPGPVTTARVAPPEHQLQRGQSVVSVGCDNGADPTAKHSRINSLDKFLGPANVQVAGQPVEGRSGGGLFSADGLVIGVCNAADPQDGEGLFAAAECIHDMLDEAGLAYVYDPAQQAPVPADPASDPGAGARLAEASPPPADAPERRGALEEIEWPGRDEPSPVRTVAATQDDLPLLDPDERIALEEIRRRLDEGYEVVCIIRPRNDPQAKSEVLVLDRVSPSLRQHLEAASHAAERPRFTSSRQ
ncbi:MAG: S1 family peptidase, partial [Thermoguttaceae bacterium]